MVERKKLLLRLDPAVYDAIAKWAADDLRSVNAQIEFALRQALQQSGRDRFTRSDSSRHAGDSVRDDTTGA